MGPFKKNRSTWRASVAIAEMIIVPCHTFNLIFSHAVIFPQLKYKKQKECAGAAHKSLVTLIQRVMRKCCFKFLSPFIRWRRRSAVCFTRAKHCPGSRHVRTTGAALHRAAQGYSCRYEHGKLQKYLIELPLLKLWLYTHLNLRSTLVLWRFHPDHTNG